MRGSNPYKGKRFFSIPKRHTGSGAHSASNGYRCSFPGAKADGACS